jgi:hypothetical protein
MLQCNHFKVRFIKDISARVKSVTGRLLVARDVNGGKEDPIKYVIVLLLFKRRKYAVHPVFLLVKTLRLVVLLNKLVSKEYYEIQRIAIIVTVINLVLMVCY